MLVLNELMDICPLRLLSTHLSISFMSVCLSKSPDCVNAGILNVILLSLNINADTENATIAINTNSNSLVEFAIIGNNDPVSIAHELLHLFGAVDFYRYPYGKQYWENKDIDFLKSEFPTSIMHLPSDKDPKNFTIDPFTKYCIGWTDSLETKYDGLNKGKTKMTQKIFKNH